MLAAVRLTRVALARTPATGFPRRGLAGYTATATSTGGRSGHVASSEGFKADMRMPKALGGPGNADGSVNPEILFASGYAACFIGALGVAAKNLKLKLPKDTQVTAHVTLGTPDLKLSAVLEGRFPGLSREEGEQLMAKGHEICPYSNATRNNCPVELKVV